MERFLLFDSDCGKCSRIAQTIEPETHGWLSVRSLWNPEMQALLTRANPNWSWKPTLLEVESQQVRAFTGKKMALRFLFGLGPIRSWHIGRQLNKEGVLQYAILFAK